jgi:hypothetical protein
MLFVNSNCRTHILVDLENEASRTRDSKILTHTQKEKGKSTAYLATPLE